MCPSSINTCFLSHTASVQFVPCLFSTTILLVSVSAHDIFTVKVISLDVCHVCTTNTSDLFSYAGFFFRWVPQKQMFSSPARACVFFHAAALTIWDVNIRCWTCSVNVPRTLPLVRNILLLVSFFDKHGEQSWIRCCREMSQREKVRSSRTKREGFTVVNSTMHSCVEDEAFYSTPQQQQQKKVQGRSGLIREQQLLRLETQCLHSNEEPRWAELHLIHSNHGFNWIWQP